MKTLTNTNYFKEKRLEAKLGRRAAALEIGISWFHLRNIENYQRSPSTSTLIKMSSVYKCDLAELVRASMQQKILA